MSDNDIRGARERIDTVEKRIAALADAGVDVAALRAQLAFAHGALREGRLADIEAICDEVLSAARRLAELGGTRSGPHPTQTRTPAHGTEAVQRVKVQRAQLAEEVRAAIDAEVRSQMTAPDVAAVAQRVEEIARRLGGLENRPREAELAPLAAQIDQLSRRIAEQSAASGDLRLVAERVQSLEVRLATSETRPAAAPDDGRLAAIEQHLRQLEARPADPGLPAGVADQLAGIARRLQAIEDHPAAIPAAVTDQLAAIARRLQAIEDRPAALPPEVEARLAAIESRPDPGAHLSEQLGAIDARLQRLGDAPALPEGLDARLAALESRPALDAAAIAATVAKTVDEAVPRQASELLREAISKLPTRDDLQHIAETLRTDLDWRLERAAAEHGWCSLSDVQSTVRKAIAEQDPSAGGPAPSQIARLESALAEFVQHSKEQQDRLITALAERVAQHTKTLTRRMIVRDPARPPGGDSEELPPSSSDHGHSSSHLAAITGAVQRVLDKDPGEAHLDPVPPEALERTRHEHGHTTLLTKRVESIVGTEPPVEAGDPMPAATTAPAPAAADSDPTLHDLVTAAVESALGGADGGVASTINAAPAAGSTAKALALTPEAPPPGTRPVPARDPSSSLRPIPMQDASSGARPTPDSDATPSPSTASVPPGIDAIVAAEVARQVAMTGSIQVPALPEADLARAVARALPAALQDEAVRTELFAVLALEATARPGALGELTGLRRFLKRELQAMADEVARRQPA